MAVIKSGGVSSQATCVLTDEGIIGLMEIRRLSILGVGLLGGSIGLALKARLSRCCIAGYAHNTQTLELALKRGALDEGFDAAGPAVRGADLVIVCTPVSVVAPLLAKIAADLTDGAVVTDVGSTKQSIVEAGEKFAAGKAAFVGSHPMAGSDKRGVAFARPDLFDGAVCITTPTPRTDASALEKVEGLWKVLGMRVERLDPFEHDRLLASVSHLPHAIAAALIAIQEERALQICGKGFLDTTRIAGADAGLWRDILLDNQHNVRAGIQLLRAQIDRLESWLKAGNGEELEKWLSAASERRSGIFRDPSLSRPPDTTDQSMR